MADNWVSPGTKLVPKWNLPFVHTLLHIDYCVKLAGTQNQRLFDTFLCLKQLMSYYLSYLTPFWIMSWLVASTWCTSFSPNPHYQPLWGLFICLTKVMLTLLNCIRTVLFKIHVQITSTFCYISKWPWYPGDEEILTVFHCYCVFVPGWQIHSPRIINTLLYFLLGRRTYY